MPTPFLGREPERRAIEAVLARVRAGSPSGIVFVGRAGVGKTRLLREVPVRAPIRRRDLVGYEPEATIPLAAARPVLGRLARSDRGNETSRDEQGSMELLRVFEAAFAELAASAPTVLFVDDVQWLDRQTAALVHYLMRGALAGGVGLGLVASARPGPESAPTVEALDRLFGEAGASAIRELGPLNERESIALVRSVSPTATDATASRLWRRVGGSPYWLQALAGASGHDPTAAIRERLDRLSGDGAALIGLLAVAAKPTDVSAAAELLDWPVERAAAAARDVGRAGLAVDGIDGLRPVHDLVREAVATTLPEHIARAHHRRLAAGYEAMAGGDLHLLAAALAHRTSAGAPAVDLAVRLATAARRRWLGRAGLDALLDVADAADPSDPQLPTLRLEVARLASELGVSDVALERWRPLVAAGGPEVQAEARLAAANEAYRLGRVEELRSLIQPPATGRWGSVEAVEIKALEASSLLWLESRSADGQALAAAVLQDARALAATEPAGRNDAAQAAYRAALKVAFEARMQAEDWRGLPALARELVDATAELDGRARVDALLYETMAIRYRGGARSRQRSADRAAEARELARREFLPDLMVEAGAFLGQSLHALGRLREAETVVLETIEIAQRVGDFSKLRTRPTSLLWEIRLSLGPWREALAELEAAATELDPHYRLAQRQIAASAVSRIEGRGGALRVRELVEASLADAATAGCTRCRREAQLVGAVSLARVGDGPAARALLALARDDSSPEPFVEGMRAWARALVDVPGERLGPDVDGLREVVAACRLTGHNMDALWASIDLGRALIPADASLASQVLRDAGREAAAMEAETQARVVDRLLRSLGQRTWRRSRSEAPGEATGREGEVADLIAGGASNAEIADRLFVSVKTVERHVSNLLAKYDARNRTELAQRWSARSRRATGTKG